MNRMKNIFVGVMAFAVCVLLVQCRKPSFTDFGNHGNVDFPDALTVTTGDNSKGEFNTVEKKLKYLWKNNDVLFVYSGKKAGDGNFVGSKFLGKLDLIEGKDTYTGTFYGGVKKPAEGDTHLRFIHFGTSVSTASDGTASVSFASQTGTLEEISQKVVAVGEVEINKSGIYDGCRLEPQFSVAMLKFTDFPSPDIVTGVTVGDITVSGIAANQITVSNTGDVSFTVSSTKDGATMVLDDAVGTATTPVNEYYAVFMPENGKREHVFSSSVSGTDLSGTKSFKMSFQFIANRYYYGEGGQPFECKGTWEGGVLPGKFSVSETVKVQFSQGNLVYDNKKFYFHENQYDRCFTKDGGDVSSSYKETGRFDLFCWGTSGYVHRTNYYQPWSTGGNTADYYAYGVWNKNLYDSKNDGSMKGMADWGYNAISNGGNTENSGWRTLSKEDWKALLDREDGEGKLYSEGIVHSVKGFIILPDSWVKPSDVTFTQGAFVWVNNFSDADWFKMEVAGAVFLPAAGYRKQSNVHNTSESSTPSGYYWSSSYASETKKTDAEILYFYNSSVSYYNYNGNHSESRNRNFGFAVRLIK